MNTAAASLSRDPFRPRRPAGMRAGLALALLAHVLLIAGLAFNVDWHSSEPTTIEAELWSALPQQAAPRAVESQATPPPPPVVRAPPPPPAAAPLLRPQPVQPSAPPQVDPQIATEKARQAKQAQNDRELAEQEQARREKGRRDRARQEEVERQQRAEREQSRAREQQQQQARDEQARKQLLADKAQKLEKENADRSAAAATQQAAAARAAYLKRIQGLAGASGDNNATGSAARSSGPSSGYAGRIMARIKPNIVYPDAIEGNPTASVEVHVAADGTITSRHLVQSSGVKSWDEAVLRAIDRTDGLPRDVDGRVQPVMLISFKPQP